MRTDEQLIRDALDAARGAGPRDVPIGAVIVAADGTELARAANAREALGDPTAHAEIIAMRAAAEALGDGWRLEGTTLAVTVEPCTMCAGALVMARVARLVFGAWEPKTGAVGSLWDVVRDRRLTHRPQVRGGVLADECAAPLEVFFARQRCALARRAEGSDERLHRSRDVHQGRDRPEVHDPGVTLANKTTSPSSDWISGAGAR